MKRAHQAADWQQFMQEADVLPNLKWMPSTSPNPGADHMPFWGTILPIDDPFWDQHRPGDRWNCKCSLTATDEPTTPVPSVAVSQQPKNTPQKGLENNPGKDAAIFSDKHPYIANAYPGAKEAVKNAVAEKDTIREEFNSYDRKQWVHSYISKKQNGFVVTDKKRLEEAKTSKNERDKFKKEYRLCRVAADNGHKVEFLKGTNRTPGQTYDIRLDGVPTDLKATASISNIVKYAKKAYKKQGAKAVLFEFEKSLPEVYDKLNEAKRKYNIHIYFYFKGDNVIKNM